MNIGSYGNLKKSAYYGAASKRFELKAKKIASENCFIDFYHSAFFVPIGVLFLIIFAAIADKIIIKKQDSK